MDLSEYQRKAFSTSTIDWATPQGGSPHFWCNNIR
jgi:hypothetical protein